MTGGSRHASRASASAEEMEAAILALAAEAGTGRSIDPSAPARRLAPDAEWQHLLPLVRRVAIRLALDGRLVIYRKGKPVDPADFKGVYRLGLPGKD